MLCRCGWPLWKVQFRARWASQAVKGYTEEVFGEIAQMWRISEKEALAHKQRAGTGDSREPAMPRSLIVKHVSCKISPETRRFTNYSGRPAAAGLPASKEDSECGYLSQRAKACFAGGASKETKLKPRIQSLDLAHVPPNTSTVYPVLAQSTVGSLLQRDALLKQWESMTWRAEHPYAGPKTSLRDLYCPLTRRRGPVGPADVFPL